jgi:ubiquinone/menaquinone biosynthesis C-methylase UbiE
MTRDRVEKYYDDHSSRYDSERSKGYFDLVNSLEFDKIREAVAGRAVLEVGCGTGLILQKVSTLTEDTIGVDLSDRMLEVARQKGLDVKKGDVTALGFPDDVFDVVYSFKVLPHVPEIRQAMEEIVRVTKPDGKIFVEFYNPYSFKALTNGISSILRGGKALYIRYDTFSKVRSYLPEGWEVKSIRGVRIFAPFARLYTLPGLSRLFCFLEGKCCDSVLRIFGGYMVFEIGPVSYPGGPSGVL